MHPLHRLSVFMLSASIALISGTLSAEEVPPGTRLGPDTLEGLRDKIFQGHRIGDLLLPEIEWQIKTHGLTLTLTEAKPYAVDRAFQAATARYSDDVRLDPATHMILGWKAGVPFPDVDVDSDPHAALKVIWNMARGRPQGDAVVQPRYAFLLIDGRTGDLRVQTWRFVLFKMKGRYGPGAEPVLGDGTIYEKELNIALEPQDLRGVGTFTIRYDTGQVNDSWAYVRDIRRTRRLSGGAWMEPIGSTDILGDDFGGFNAHPSWYESFEIVGRGSKLVVANTPSRAAWVPEAGSADAQFPRVDLSRSPHFNIVDNWEPRDVYIVKATPKDDHPQGYKHVVIDSTTWNAFANFGYDKEGRHYKTYLVSGHVFETVDNGAPALFEPWSMGVDFDRLHATMYASAEEVHINAPIGEDDVSLSVLEAQGR